MTFLSEVPDQDVRKHGPVKGIVRWTQEQIVQDFVEDSIVGILRRSSW